MLREFLLRGGGDRDVVAKHDGARGGGALIDGQHEGHGGFSWCSRVVIVVGCVCTKASGLAGEGQYDVASASLTLPWRGRVDANEMSGGVG